MPNFMCRQGNIVLSLPALVAAIPEPYVLWDYYDALVIAAAAMAANQIPVPNNPSSKLWWAYQVISFLARNSGEATSAHFYSFRMSQLQIMQLSTIKHHNMLSNYRETGLL